MPPSYPANLTAAFGVVATVSNATADITYDWNFGDGSAHSTNAHASHTYRTPGTYPWSVVSRASTASVTNTGAIVIGTPLVISATPSPGEVTLSWPRSIADTLLERSPILGPTAQWVWVTNELNMDLETLSLTVPASGTGFYRVRRPW